MQTIARLQGILCLLALLLSGSAALAQTANADAGKVLLLRRAPELTELVDAKTPGYFPIREMLMIHLLPVDFNKEMLLAAVMGAQTFVGGVEPSISIIEVREFPDRLVATVQQHTNEIDYNQSFSFRTAIFPLDVVAVSKSDKPVYFIVNAYTDMEFTGSTAVYPILHAFTGSISHIDKPTTSVITNAHAWQALWKDSINATPPELNINFTRQMAIAIFSGKEGGGFAPLSVTSDGKRLLLSYRHDVAIEMEQIFIPTPYQIAIIPTSKLPVVFQDVTPGRN